MTLMLVKVKFIKAHFSGIPEGSVKEIEKRLSDRLISEGYCEEVKAKKPRSLKKTIYTFINLREIC